MKKTEILANRLLWAKSLQLPENEKAIEKLEDFDNNNERCCLGHGCHYLGIERITNDEDTVSYDDDNTVAPESFINAVGLCGDIGIIKNKFRYADDIFNSLASLNDHSEITPQEIGVIMERNWLQGGDNTPFRPLSDYED